MPRNYTNIIDYARTQLDTFEQREVCRVDSLILSWLTYYRLPEQATAARTNGGMAIKDLNRADWFDTMCEPLYDTQSSVALIGALAASPRFRDALVCGYVEHTDEVTEKQFSAMTFRLGAYDTFVAFRGTDNTLVGWKEDFNMAFKDAVPSQLEAVRYLEDVAARCEGRLWCGGHSKGGNLAVYASVMCAPAVRQRVQTCFSHDGPGFSAKTMADSRWEGVAEIVDKTIPQSSVIGMMFEQQENDFMVVHSVNSGFSQHDPFSWEVVQCDFVRYDRLGRGANFFDETMNAWFASVDDEERERLIDLVFDVIYASGESTFGDIRRNWLSAMPRMLAAGAKLDANDREIVKTALSDVARVMVGQK